MTQEIATQPVQDESTQMTVRGVHTQVQLIQEVMKSEMKKGEHFGVIPGCGDKPALMKAGAEKLSLLFKLAPKFQVELVDLGGGHREYRIVTELYHIVTGNFMGQGLGSCSTMESKYRWRNMGRKCPACEGEFIIKGKEQYGGGWLCFAKKGGCGAKFKDDEPAIVSQEVGKKENEDIADTYNTCLKMGKKRSLVDAILTATAASDIFTQDIDEMGATATEDAPPQHREPIREPQPLPAEESQDAEVIDEREPGPEEDFPPAAKEPPKSTPSGGSKDRMQSRYDNALCRPCGKKIKKGDWIRKTNAGTWVHETCLK